MEPDVEEETFDGYGEDPVWDGVEDDSMTVWNSDSYDNSYDSSYDNSYDMQNQGQNEDGADPAGGWNQDGQNPAGEMDSDPLQGSASGPGDIVIFS